MLGKVQLVAGFQQVLGLLQTQPALLAQLFDGFDLVRFARA